MKTAMISTACWECKTPFQWSHDDAQVDVPGRTGREGFVAQGPGGSSCESSVVAELHQQAFPADLQRCAETARFLDQIPADVEIGLITADDACDTRRFHDAVADRRADAVISPRRNARPGTPSTAGAIARNEELGASQYPRRRHLAKWTGYHRRSRGETKMHFVKLLGQSLMARDFDRQAAALRGRAAVLGIPITEPMGQVRLGKARSERHLLRATKPVRTMLGKTGSCIRFIHRIGGSLPAGFRSKAHFFSQGCPSRDRERGAMAR